MDQPVTNGRTVTITGMHIGHNAALLARRIQQANLEAVEARGPIVGLAAHEIAAVGGQYRPGKADSTGRTVAVVKVGLRGRSRPRQHEAQQEDKLSHKNAAKGRSQLNSYERPNSPPKLRQLDDLARLHQPPSRAHAHRVESRRHPGQGQRRFDFGPHH